jgi:hypothetical protein
MIFLADFSSLEDESSRLPAYFNRQIHFSKAAFNSNPILRYKNNLIIHGFFRHI